MNRPRKPVPLASKPVPAAPLNRYSWWQNLLIVLVVVFSIVYATPNLYKPDPAVQVSGTSATVTFTEYQQHQALVQLAEAGIAVKSAEPVGNSWVVRLQQQEQQLQARDLLEKFFVGDYVVALNLVDTTPDWLSAIGARPMKLGLDLSGGVHFLLQVDTAGMVEKRMESLLENVDKALRESGMAAADWDARINGLTVHIDFSSEETRSRGLVELRNKMPELEQAPGTLPARSVALQLTEAKKRELEDYAVDQNLSALRSRINSLGVAEPVVQRQGRNRIVVELPGIQDTTEAKKIIGQTANLEFRLGAEPGTLASRKQSFPMKQNPAEWVSLEKKVILEGDCVEEVFPSLDQNNLPVTVIHLNASCGREMHRATAKRVGRQMGIVLSETRIKTRLTKNEAGQDVVEEYRTEEKQVISYATVRSALGSQFQIEGLSQAEAQTLSVLLRAGALAAPLYFVEERTVGPSMGQENIRAGVISSQVGFALVILFVLAYYRFFGIAANVALLVNVSILVACMSLFGATLTMPGIAGIVLTVGMAVDANVLINSRIKEELAKGTPPQQAIEAGYDRAFITILDSNLTTLLAAVILFAIGTGPVQGFAITLSIGIMASMFTAITLTRAIVNAWYGNKKVSTLSI